ncbi:MAG: MBL fold metallo-hydrolase [Proteobacteria bacterium]|jgi:glyoxylase-like metal-dependent hydrolase (beta-lactamase superfamily II)|nr:MBL fold metallo-hydrolase [Pseudomonadota bacterium]
MPSKLTRFLALPFAFILTIAAMASGFSTLTYAQGAPEAEPEREILHINGDLYRFRQGRHSGVFLATPEGIIVVDPTFPEQAAWLKNQLDERFGLPVKYVIYSHTHNDHAGGGEVFADTAIFIGHENTRKNLQRPDDNAPLLPREQLWDANHDGMIQQSEAGGYIGVDQGEEAFARFDTDDNGSLSRAEIWAARFGGPTVRAPDIYYSEQAAITLGGKTVELHYTGRNHSDDMTVVLFPAERAIYTADFLTPNRLAWTVLDGGFLPDWVESLQQVEQLDFDTIVPAHESPGTKAQVSEQTRYMEDLYSAVSEGIAAGKSEQELVDSILMEDYSHVLEYEYSRAGNVSGAYEILISTPGEH